MSLRDDTFTANTKANKKLEPIPWGHHSSVPATRSGPRAVTPPASTSPYFSRSRARTRPSAFITSRRLAPGVGLEGGVGQANAPSLPLSVAALPPAPLFRLRIFCSRGSLTPVAAPNAFPNVFLAVDRIRRNGFGAVS